MKNNQQEFYPVALTIAGSDSGGGAGIQADLRTFSAAGVYGCSVITAVTAQNPREVISYEAVSCELLKAQYEAVIGTIAVKAIKVGMLANESIVKCLCKCLKNNKLPLVVDPVMISTSNTPLLDEKGLVAVKEQLLPMADMITPNLPEAQWLLNRKLASFDDYAEAALELASIYKCHVLLKTGHAPNTGKASDIVVLDGKCYLLSSPAVNDLGEFTAHGTGCTLSSAITAMLASNSSWKDALKAAKAYVYGSLCETAVIGKELDAMYPPLDDYSSMVSLTPYDKNGRKVKGKK